MRKIPCRILTLPLTLWLMLMLFSIPAFAEQWLPASPAAAVRMASAGDLVFWGEGAEIDYSHTSQGYVMARYTGPASRIKVQIGKGSEAAYTYDLNTAGDYETFSLTQGSGSYTISVFRQVFDNRYAKLTEITVDVALESEALPFLYPNQQVNFSADSQAVRKAEELAQGAADSLEVMARIYRYVTALSYDHQKAEEIAMGLHKGYLPDLDEVMESGTGICFDYASLMAAMLRSQNIPAQLQMGYLPNGVYHAWVSVWSDTAGWVDGAYVGAAGWTRMDPTFASGGQSAGMVQYVGNGNHYSVSYVY